MANPYTVALDITGTSNKKMLPVPFYLYPIAGVVARLVRLLP